LIAWFAPTLVAGLIQFTHALNCVKNSFDLSLLYHSLEYDIHSAELALMGTLWAFLQFVLQGCQIGHFMASFEKFGHFLTALAMKKRIWPFCKISSFFGHSFGLSL